MSNAVKSSTVMISSIVDTRRMGAKSDLPRPFVKWVGGKRQLVSCLLSYTPREFCNYHEPFVGGGAFFFALWRKGELKSKKIHLSDANSELIDSYRAIQRNVEEVLQHLSERYFTHNRENFYKIRSLDPRRLSREQRTARMIFLNRTGFNGLYRVNSRGQFNVPFGRHKNPTIRDPNNLRAVSRSLKGVKLHHEGFERVLERTRRGDFVYFDPPYVPLSRTANFVQYAQDGFSMKDQERLCEVFKTLDKKGVLVMLSNSNTQWVQDHYKQFQRVSVQAKRNINSRSDRRGPVDELLVLNYNLC